MTNFKEIFTEEDGLKSLSKLVSQLDQALGDEDYDSFMDKLHKKGIKDNFLGAIEASIGAKKFKIQKNLEAGINKDYKDDNKNAAIDIVRTTISYFLSHGNK